MTNTLNFIFWGLIIATASGILGASILWRTQRNTILMLTICTIAAWIWYALLAHLALR